jgi:hypothetical protein
MMEFGVEAAEALVGIEASHLCVLGLGGVVAGGE